jgi:hypothetical protein
LTTSEAYRYAYNRCYELLDYRAGCRIETRVKKARDRAILGGLSKSQVNQITALNVIDADKRLKEIFDKIISELVIKFVV